MMTRDNITVETAVGLILSKISPISDTEMVPLSMAAGRILAQDAAAEFDNPPFDRSPVDGYACRFEDTVGATEQTPVILTVTEEIDAGGYSDAEVMPGCAVRIMTGAAIPPGCDCCIYQEDTDYGEDRVKIFREMRKWDNYCFAGEDFKKGTVLLKKGTRITHVEAAVLAGMGKTEIIVYRKARVALLTSGDEVVEPGSVLAPGKIYNSNLTMLRARLSEFGLSPYCAESIPDDPTKMAQALKRVAEEADLIVTTGAVSVGKKDIMHEALQIIGAERIFWGIQLKPGMPTLFSMYGQVPVLSLSGNPFGVAVTAEFLVRPALHRLAQDDSVKAVRVTGIMEDTLDKPIRGRRIVRAFYKDGKFTLPKGLHSNGVISSMVGCNCLIDVSAENGKTVLEKGMKAEAILL